MKKTFLGIEYRSLRGSFIQVAGKDVTGKEGEDAPQTEKEDALISSKFSWIWLV